MLLKKLAFFLSAFTCVVSQGILNLPIKGTRTHVPRFERHEGLLRRTAEFSLTNLLVYYEIELEIGTPAQTVGFTIDTGSSDLWVMDSSNPYCAKSDNQRAEGSINCTESAIFDSNSSSTFTEDKQNLFNITYGDRSFAKGHYATDSIKFGDQTLKNANFALALQANSTIAVFGVGPVAGEASVTNFDENGSPENAYFNVPALLKNQGIIDVAAYSLWLNDLNASEGQILFGGVDHAKYIGTLQLVPMVARYFVSDASEDAHPGLRDRAQQIQREQPYVMLHHVYLYNGAGKAGLLADIGMPALLDSGTTLSFLPSNIITNLARSIGASYNSEAERYLTYCDVQGGLAFDFSGVLITIPYEQFLIPAISSSGEPATSNGRSICLLPVSTTTKRIILGDVILRSMYCVFDNDNFEVALANTRFNASDSNVEPISNEVPSASSAPSYSSTSTHQRNTAWVVSSQDYTTSLALASYGSEDGTSLPGRSTYPTLSEAAHTIPSVSTPAGSEVDAAIGDDGDTTIFAGATEASPTSRSVSRTSSTTTPTRSSTSRTSTRPTSSRASASRIPIIVSTVSTSSNAGALGSRGDTTENGRTSIGGSNGQKNHATALSAGSFYLMPLAIVMIVL